MTAKKKNGRRGLEKLCFPFELWRFRPKFPRKCAKRCALPFMDFLLTPNWQPTMLHAGTVCARLFPARTVGSCLLTTAFTASRHCSNLPLCTFTRTLALHPRVTQVFRQN